ncbi:DUF2809 domain-containing protein [Cryobacterium luteum]|uniref:DUF2809 domain-containing protein n=2 Tax=Microbacteriaceae TaxID=85023 RepID=A0A5F0D7B8_9MICO|nr:DUF2809 domain-containing protein [Cryobacterium luteum]
MVVHNVDVHQIGRADAGELALKVGEIGGEDAGVDAGGHPFSLSSRSSCVVACHLGGVTYPQGMQRSHAPDSHRIRPGSRSRRNFCVFAAVNIGAGLMVHFTTAGPVGDFAADALYAVLAYLVVSFIAPRLRQMGSAAVAFLACAAVEAAQLSPAPAALADAFPPARLVLGTTFAPVDLLAYAVGVLAALVCDRLIPRARDRARSG